MSLVGLSLQKSPWQRLLEHDEAMAFAQSLREMVEQTHAKS
jgi:hypothetical protein